MPLPCLLLVDVVEASSWRWRGKLNMCCVIKTPEKLLLHFEEWHHFRASSSDGWLCSVLRVCRGGSRPVNSSTSERCTLSPLQGMALASDFLSILDAVEAADKFDYFQNPVTDDIAKDYRCAGGCAGAACVLAELYSMCPGQHRRD